MPSSGGLKLPSLDGVRSAILQPGLALRLPRCMQHAHSGSLVVSRIRMLARLAAWQASLLTLWWGSIANQPVVGIHPARMATRSAGGRRGRVSARRPGPEPTRERAPGAGQRLSRLVPVRDTCTSFAKFLFTNWLTRLHVQRPMPVKEHHGGWGNLESYKPSTCVATVSDTVRELGVSVSVSCGSHLIHTDLSYRA